MAGSVNDIDSVSVAFWRPKTSRGRRLNGNSSFSLLLHPVHNRSPLVNIANLVGLARVIENPLGRSSLAGINMGDNANVPQFL